MKSEMERVVLEKLNTMANGFGQYAPIPGNDSSSGAKLMQSALEEIELQVTPETTPTVEYALAIALAIIRLGTFEETIENSIW